MERKRFTKQPCPIAQATDIFGDWWVPMILRETLYGAETFSDFQSKLGISRNILNQRLKLLVSNGVFEKVLYQKPSRYRYKLTSKGKAALSIVAAMVQWSNDWVFQEGEEPISVVDRETQLPIRPAMIDLTTGKALKVDQMELRPGPGFPSCQEVRDWRFGV